MDCEEKKTLLLNELERLNKLIGKDNWDIVRNPKNYILKQKKYKWGIRNFYKIPDENYNKYLDMQASRGIDDYRFEGIDNYIQKRIDEIKNNTKRTAADKNDNRYKEIKKFLIDTNRIDSLYEIGFRLPIVLDFYKNNENLNVRGCDTVKSNVLLGELLNYNVDYIDFNKMEEIKNLKISEKTCLVSYHCFEHLENPFESLQTLYSIMPKNSYLQIEIPIEENKIPNIKIGHLQTFYRNDLKNMLMECGFLFLNSYNDFGNERHIVYK
jgi:hypothetical protein